MAGAARDPYACGIVGNGETAALIAEDASVTWLCVPRFDGPLLFASALDPRRGGAWELRINGAAIEPRGQAYLPDTNVLVTRGRAAALEVEVVDWMPWGTPALVRQVRLANPGRTAVPYTVVPAARPVRSRCLPWRRAHFAGHQVLRFNVAAPVIGRACFLPPDAPGGLVAAWGPDAAVEAAVAPGESVVHRWALGYGPSRDVALEAVAAGHQADLARAVAFWQGWLGPARRPPLAEPRLEERYRRSLLTLKLLQHQSGAIVAAATASWPATPGGADNWDYRFCWLRDGCYAAAAFDLAGFHAEAAAFYRFALGLVQADGDLPWPVVNLDGRPPGELEAEDLAGPRGERPVRLGNAAAHQLQLDSAGHVLHGLLSHAHATGDTALLRAAWPAARRAADWVRKNWRRVEHGLWEDRDRQAHWTHGKVLCWVALDRAAAIARLLGRPRVADRYAAAAARVARFVLRHGWSAARSSFVQTDEPGACLDVSVLSIDEYGLLPPDDPRVALTVAALEQPAPGGLLRPGGVARFQHAPQPFVLATFWLARHHARAGQVERALELLNLALSSANALDLMAEHADPETARPAGNFPQVFSHEEFVRASWELAGAAGVPAPGDRAGGAREPGPG